MTTRTKTLWLLAWLELGLRAALAQSGDGTMASLLAQAEAKSPEVALVLFDGRENEIFTRRATYEPGRDIYDIRLAHLSGKYFLWQANFGDSPMVEDGVFTLCLDTDRNDNTGINADEASSARRGTDLEVSFVQGKAVTRNWKSDGAPGDSAEFAVSMLTHTSGTPKPPMSDNTARVEVKGFSLKSGKKLVRPTGWRTVGGTSRAYGLDVIRPWLWAPTTVAIEYDKLELSGFDIDYYTTLEYGHIKPLRPDAVAAYAAPKGKFHVGFMIFDRRDEGARVGIRIDGVEKGSAAINAANNNYWLYWLDQPVDFHGGELVELVALAGTASLPINFLLFMTDPPPPREQSCKVDSLTFRVSPDASGDVHLSWISENPAPTRLEYGAGNFSCAYESPDLTLLHRAVLWGLDKHKQYQARAVGRDL